MDSTKILFLDIDGVINSDDNRDALSSLWHLDSKLFKSKDQFGKLFDERCVRWLQLIILQTQCKIVISSTWRDSGLKVMQLMWEMRDLPGEVIDITPVTVDSEVINLYATTNNEADRGYEIQEWLDINKPFRYCIADDHSDMLSHQHFVKITDQTGLTRKTAWAIIAILNAI